MSERRERPSRGARHVAPVTRRAALREAARCLGAAGFALACALQIVVRHVLLRGVGPRPLP